MEALDFSEDDASESKGSRPHRILSVAEDIGMVMGPIAWVAGALAWVGAGSLLLQEIATEFGDVVTWSVPPSLIALLATVGLLLQLSFFLPGLLVRLDLWFLERTIVRLELIVHGGEAASDSVLAKWLLPARHWLRGLKEPIPVARHLGPFQVPYYEASAIF